MKHALTIAGSDCSGGAGIQADLKTFAAHGIYGMSAIVSVVAENTCRVLDIQDVTPDMIEKQIIAVFEDIEVRCKSGHDVYPCRYAGSQQNVKAISSETCGN